MKRRADSWQDKPCDRPAGERMELVAKQLDERFRQRLCALVAQEMNKIYRRRMDAEDIVQSVFATYFRRVEAGDYVIDDIDQLWYLLKKIAANKLRKRIEFECAAKRDVRLDSPGDDVMVDLPGPAECRLFETAIENALDRADLPIREIFEFQLLGYDVADAITHMLEGLTDLHIQVLRLRLQGMTQDEISEALQRGRTVVRNCLRRLRQRAGAISEQLQS